jgi:hypothetical protein
MQRVSAPERTREELRSLMNAELGTAAGRSDLLEATTGGGLKNRQHDQHHKSVRFAL